MNKKLKIVGGLLSMVIIGMIVITLSTPKMNSLITPDAPITTNSDITKPIVIDTLQDIRMIVREIAAAEPSLAQARADELWQTLVNSQRVPLVLGEQVIFFYKGQADQVSWRGVFNGWGEPGLEGARIGQTDLWIGQIAFQAASRVEYKIVLNNQDWIVDPANPNTEMSGLTGENSVMVMPGFTVTDESQKRTDVAAGLVTGDLSIESGYLGYLVNYRVYTPLGYEKMDQLPVLYVLDGNDFIDERMGALPNILDNLIADGRIHPVLVVFVDAREPGNPQVNRRETEFLVYPVEHARFIAEELVPAIDLSYRTDPQPDARTVVGVSYGGVSSIFIASTQSNVFHNIAAFSPSLWVLDSPQYLTDPRYVEGSQLMYPSIQAATKCGGDTGITCPSLPLKVFMTAGVPSWDVGDLYPLVMTLRDQQYPVEYHPVLEGHAWSHWRGLSDEMLIYFFGNN